MDPDMQFNALAALSQSVTHDLKQSFPAWDMVAQKAVKLSQQLRSTAQCLTSFCDALQNVSDDCGNNLKGATRDVATCLTRISMRQRALESRFRSLADAFSEELARGLSERTNYWKQRAAELEKTNVKHIKKVRGRKKRPDGPSLSEQKQICTQILGEQRQNFQFFCSMLMPVLKAEMTLLDEGPHIRQAVETLETTIECVDSTALVDTIVTDITQGVDGAWKQCLDNATLRFREKSLTGSEFDLTPMSRPQSLPVSENGIIHGGEGVLASKPPRRPISRSNSKSSCISPPLNQSPLSDSMFNMSQFGPGRLMRPHSINGIEPYGTHQPPVPMQSGPGSCSSEASAAMYSETLQQIDQLGSDLENFCTSAFDMRYITDPIPPNQATPYNSNIKMREHSKPPPPARRNSTITAATPTAPSVADARSNYFKGSRQSLNSSLYSGSTTDLHHHPVNSQPHPMTPMAQNVNPYNKHSTFTPNYNL